jgi:hypothetical protein
MMWISAAVVLVIGLIVIGVIGTQPGGFLAAVVPTATATDLPTDTPTLTLTSTLAAATAALVPTDQPAIAPTLIPATSTAILTPVPSTNTPVPPTSTLTATSTVTNTPSITPLPPNVLLIYDDVAFTLHNQSGATLSLRGVVFRSANGNWEARSWGLSLITSLPDNDCLRLRDIATGDQAPPAICGELYGFQLVGAAAHFWRNVPSFDVVRSGTVLATCSTDEATCAIHIPQE